LGGRLVVFTPTGSTIGLLGETARRTIGQTAEVEAVKRVIRHNPDNVWAIARASRYDAGEPEAEGMVSFLMLNEKGAEALAAGTLNPADPDLVLLTRQNQKPAAIYVWALCAPGPLSGAIPLVFEKISTPLYRDVDIFARAATDDGRRFLEAIGFKLGAHINNRILPHLYVFERSESLTGLQRPLYDSYVRPAKAGALGVTVARTFEDLARVISMRSTVYMAEQECPYEEEFDGNDLSGTHLLGYVGDEPAGCLRIRYFKDFMKIERLAVRHEFRAENLGHLLVRAAIDFGRMKGYQQFYGHPQKRLVEFWQSFGFRNMKSGQEFVFSDFDYIEMIGEVDEMPGAISAFATHPYIINRPEGQWHIPGILERSAARKVTRPSVDAPSRFKPSTKKVKASL
jgi:predicted GNAT family N-acyltransferase